MCRRNMKGHELRFSVIGACAGGEHRFTYLDSSQGEWGIKMRETKQRCDPQVEVLTIPDILEEQAFRARLIW